jgi:hypothetical protein
MADVAGKQERAAQERFSETSKKVREWDGPAVLPPLTALLGAQKHEEHIAMSRKTEAGSACTIGIDTGKNTLHLVGLDLTSSIRPQQAHHPYRQFADDADKPHCKPGATFITILKAHVPARSQNGTGRSKNLTDNHVVEPRLWHCQLRSELRRLLDISRKLPCRVRGHTASSSARLCLGRISVQGPT